MPVSASGVQLRSSGLEVEIAGNIGDVLRKRLAKAVDETVDYLVERRRADFVAEDGRDQLVSTLGTLRPVAGEMTAPNLAREVERAPSEQVASRAADLACADRPG